jgi:hypothetical protein
VGKYSTKSHSSAGGVDILFVPIITSRKTITVTGITITILVIIEKFVEIAGVNCMACPTTATGADRSYAMIAGCRRTMDVK